MSDCKGVHVPMDKNFNLELLRREKSESDILESKCRSIIGLLMYAMLAIRPDLSVSLNILSRFQSTASEELYMSLTRFLRYIQGTINTKLIFTQNYDNILEGFVDADWDGDMIGRKSTTGFIFKIFGCSVTWCTRKQQSVAISSTEAEYVALSIAVSKACWLKALLIDFNVVLTNKPIEIFEDNQSAIHVAKNPSNHKRLKHVDIRYHFVRHKVEDKTIKINYIKTEDQIADLFTKPLGKYSFEKFKTKIGLQN